MLFYNFNLLLSANTNFFLLFHSQIIDFQSCFTVSRHTFFIGFPIAISKPWILSWTFVNKLLNLRVPSKSDMSPFLTTMVKLHEKKYQNYFRVNTSPLIVIEMSILKRLILNNQQEKVKDFDSYKEYLKCISNKMLLIWQY